MRLWAPRGVPPARLQIPTNTSRGTGHIYNSGRTATPAIWSEMDARVKRAVEIGVVAVVHGGGCAGVGRSARRQRQLVTLRCAGRDRMAVSGRELPRTRFASRDRIDLFEDSQVGRAGRPTPAGSVWMVRQRQPRVVRGMGPGPSRPRRSRRARARPRSSRRSSVSRSGSAFGGVATGGSAPATPWQ